MIADYLLSVLQATGLQLLILFGPLLVLGLMMDLVSRWNERLSLRLFGQKAYMALFAWLGTSIHESGHALFALLFGHRIEEMKLFAPDPKTGTLGYVKHSWNRKNLYHIVGNFFIGIGPVLLGTILLMVLIWLLYGRSALTANTTEIFADTFNIDAYFTAAGDSIYAFLHAVFAGPENAWWKTILLIYMIFCIGGSIKLSPPDISGALKGFLFIILLFLVFNLATLWKADLLSDSLIKLNGTIAVFYFVIFLALVINLFFVIVMAGMWKLKIYKQLH
jgi:hypothetical protein